MVVKIDSFDGEYRFLSNFFVLPKPIEWEGLLYTTTEHAFQATKTLDPKEREKVRSAGSPGAAKRLGKLVKLRSDWNDMKVMVMSSICWVKFEHPILRKWLLATGDAELIEGNTWGDTFWGTVKGRGENQLGKVLMNIRGLVRRSESGD